MKSVWLSTAALAACLIVPVAASAQTDPARDQNRPAVQRSDDGRASGDARKAADNRADMKATTAAGSGWQARELIGLKIHGSNNEKIGEIHDLVVDNQGQVTAALVDVGGFLGLGEKTVAIDWKQIKVNAADKTALVSMTKDQLASLPKWQNDRQQARDGARRDNQTATVPAPGASSSSRTPPASTAPSTAPSGNR